MFQGHWTTAEMPARCVRDKGSLDATHVGEMAAELQLHWRPTKHTDIVDDEFSGEFPRRRDESEQNQTHLLLKEKLGGNILPLPR